MPAAPRRRGGGAGRARVGGAAAWLRALRLACLCLALHPPRCAAWPAPAAPRRHSRAGAPPPPAPRAPPSVESCGAGLAAAARSAKEAAEAQAADCEAKAELPRGLRAGAPNGGAALWAKLERGDPIDMAVLGSSIAADAGCTTPLPHLAAHYPNACGARIVAGNLPSPGRGWARKIFDALAEQYPTRRGSGTHRLFNLGQPATGPRNYEHCLLDSLLPFADEVDLFFLEFGVTASPGSLDSPEGRSLASLARRIATKKSRPLVVLVTFTQLCLGCPPGADEAGIAAAQAALWQCPANHPCPVMHDEAVASGNQSEWPQYRPKHLKREQLRELAELLDLPSVDEHEWLEQSLRDGVVDVAQVTEDGTHPANCGGELIASGVVAALMASHARWQCAGSPSADSSEAASLTPAEQRRCYLFSRAPEDQRSGGRSVFPTIERSEGFRYTAHAEGGRNSNKPGMVAKAPGDYVELRIDTSRDPAFVTPDAPAFLTFTYLTSYERMGKANVTCVSGCACTNTTLDAHAPMAMANTRISYAATYGILISQAKRCVVRVEVLDGERPPEAGHKFKLIGLSIGGVPEHLGGDAHPREGHGDMNYWRMNEGADLQAALPD